MTEAHLETRFGNNWRSFGDSLRRTAPAVVETFRETDLEDNFSNWYEEFMPQQRESPINFLLRNMTYSYRTSSPTHAQRLGVEMCMAKLGWYVGKVPLLSRVMKLDKFSTELFIGQEARGYVSEDKTEKGIGPNGEDINHVVFNNIARPMGLDIDVGFYRGNDYFYKINVYDDSLITPAEQTHQIIQEAKLNGVKK